MPKDVLANKIISNLMGLMNVLSQSSSHQDAGINDQQGYLRYFTGCSYPFFNGVFNHNYPSVSSGSIQSNLTFFAEKKSSFVWWWTNSTAIPAATKAELESNGFEFAGDFLGIASKLDEMSIAPIDNRIRIVTVHNAEEYQLFINIVCEIFQIPDTDKSNVMSMFQSYGDEGKFYHYLGYYLDQPVATLTCYIDQQKTVGFYNGATLPVARKHGVCSALSQYAAEKAMSLGCEYAVSQLMTSGMAKNLSVAKGAKTYCTLQPFIKTF